MGSEKKISLLVAVVVGINAMIGAGIVAIPGMLSQQAGPGGVLSFFLSVFIVLAMSSSLGSLAKIYPGEAWNYLYPSKYGGHGLGIFSANCYLAGVIVAMGFLVQQAGVWSADFIPGAEPKLLGALILVALTVTVLIGVEASSWGQYLIAGVVLCSLLVSSGACLLHFDLAKWSPFLPKGPSAIFSAAPMAMFSFLGFESIASLYSILQDPEKNVRKACVYSVLVVGGIYLIFVLAIIGAVPAERFGSGLSATLPVILESLFPQYGFLSTLVLVGGLFAIVGTLHSMIWSIAVLWRSVLERSRSTLMKSALEKGLAGKASAVVIPSFLMLIIAMTMDSELVLLASVAFIAMSYVLSISVLLFAPPEDDRHRPNRGVTLFAVLGGVLLLCFSLAKFL